MSKSTSLAAALQGFDRAPAPPPIAVEPVARSPRQVRKGQGTALSSSVQAPSRIGKKAIIGYFDPGVSKQLKQLALDKDVTIQDLLSEALNELFQKHKKPTIA
jgi:hypothetical protein